MLDMMSKTQQLVYIICFENNPSSTNLTLGWGQVCAGLPRENWQASYIIKLIRVQSVAETLIQSNINISCNFNTENWLLEFLQCSGNTLELNKNFISKHCNDSLQQILSPSFWEMISFFCQQQLPDLSGRRQPTRSGTVWAGGRRVWPCLPVAPLFLIIH